MLGGQLAYLVSHWQGFCSIFYLHVPPVFARAYAIELGMSNPKLLGDHLQAAFVALEHLLDHDYLAFVELVVFGLARWAAILELGVLTVVLVHFFTSYPLEVLVMVG